MTPKEMALTAAKALDEKKGGDIAAIEITEQTTLADYFVIATGNSNTQINALCGAVEKAMKEQAGHSLRCGAHQRRRAQVAAILSRFSIGS